MRKGWLIKKKTETNLRKQIVRIRSKVGGEEIYVLRWEK